MRKLFISLFVLFSAFTTEAQTWEESYKKGLDYLVAEDYDNAIAQFSSSIEQNKSNPEAFIKRSSAYAGKFQFDYAIADIRSAIPMVRKEKDVHAQLLQTIGLYHNQNANYDEGIRAFSDAIKVKPDMDESYWLRAQTYYYKGDFTSSIREFTACKTLKSYQFDLAALANLDYQIGEIKFKMKDYGNAIQSFNKSLENNPELGKSYYWRAKSYREITEYAKAIDDVNKSFPFFTEDKEILASLFFLSGYCKNKINDRFGAILDYTSAILNFRDYPEAFLSRGLCYKQTKQFDEAIKDFSRVISLDDKDVTAYFERAKVYNDLNKYVEARLDFNKVLELDKEKGEYRPFVFFYLNKNKREAINEMKKRLYEKNSYRSDAEYMRSEFYRMACIQSLCENIDEAFGYLDSSLAYVSGMEKNKWEVKDDELVLIKYTDKFKELLAKHKVKYTITPTLSYQIEKHMLSKFDTWKKKGEFEKKADYEIRMRGYETKQKMLITEAIDSLKKVQVKSIKWAVSNLSTYDSESETFKINISGLPDIIVPVPISDAPAFKNNVYALTLKNPDLKPRLDQWEISHLEFMDPSTKKLFVYNSNEQKNYDVSQQYAFNFGKASIGIPGIDIQAKAASKENAKPKSTITFGKSDIDIELPASRMVSPNAIAVVIGNKDYTKTKPVDYAVNDAFSMKKYLIEVAGFKEGNIIYKENATQGDFNIFFGTKENYNGMLFNLVKPNISDVFIFYSGHGCPGLKDKKGYIVPVECDPGYVEIGGYSLDVLYNNLSHVPAKSIAVVTDACFSGAAFENISPMVIKMDEPVQSLTNAVIINSSTGDQVSSWYNEQEHGTFTYFFLKAIQDRKKSDNNGDGQLTYQELFDYISNSNEGVPYFVRKTRGINQTPVIQGKLKESVFIKY